MSKRRRWTDEALITAVAANTSMSGVMRDLGLVPTGGNYKSLQIHAERLGLSVERFRGRAWNVGERYRPVMPPKPNSEIFVKGSTYQNNPKVKRRMVEAGVPDACSVCGTSAWMGKPLSLHLEHKNGDNRDYRWENLCLLCPNCHSQTATYCRRKVLQTGVEPATSAS